MTQAKSDLYHDIALQAQGLLADESDLIANLANVSALLWLNLSDINWAGFYLLKDDTLVLGPFQGKPACVRIPVGKGVCGTAAATGDIQIVENVHEFGGHIACDAASNSEIVMPFYINGQLAGVLDIDSPQFSRFDQQDAEGLARIVNILQDSLK
ncbi:GAF domain-containing protein [Neptunicella marina]|uniref:GAF domain-containing protein n=1 Tax=Neptunicella marina TaxID=2125989 RepID=A0A8J6IY32_9ALTE|nr:GAF domain-containing protein [Neptunicella marina]MBC3767492.1 GAF domain-containing protein [Neptunicella marina]